MGATRNTGYLENLIAYDASNNVAIATSVNPSYKVTLGGSLLGTSATFSNQVIATSNANTYAGGSLILKAVGSVNPIYLTSVVGNFALSNGGGTDHLLIASTGAATFSNTTSGNALRLSTSYASGRALNFGFSDGSVLPTAAFYIGNQTGVGVFIGDETTTNGLYVKSGGNVGIGTTSPNYLLHINSSTTSSILQLTNSTTGSAANKGMRLFISGNDVVLNNREAGFIGFETQDTERMRITSGGTVIVKGQSDDIVQVGDSISGHNAYLQLKAGTTANAYINSTGSGSLIFGANGAASTHMTITSGGNVLIGKTTTASATVGINLEGSTGFGGFTRGSGAAILVNRQNDDGNLVDFLQADATEGSISVSGTTVSYNGGHLARYSQTESGQRVEGLLKGTVMSNLDKMAEWINPETGQPYANEQLNCMKISDVEGDVNVAGVFVNWDEDDKTFTNDMNIAMTGDMIIRIAKDVVVEKGQLLMSAGDGTAKPQGDDIIKSKTIAKVTSNHVTCVYEDGSYCVPCVLMAC